MRPTFESNRDAFPNARLSRDDADGLEIAADVARRMPTQA